MWRQLGAVDVEPVSEPHSVRLGIRALGGELDHLATINKSHGIVLGR